MASPSAVLSIAKRQLGHEATAADSVVPKNYLNELKQHLSLFPEAHKFRVNPSPGFGFGSLTCLEAGCKNPDVNLLRNGKLPDGGISEGIGSLRAYREHVSTLHKDKGIKANAATTQDIKPMASTTAGSAILASSSKQPLTSTLARARAQRPSISRRTTMKKEQEPIHITSSPETSPVVQPRELKPLERARQRASLGRERVKQESAASSSPSSVHPSSNRTSVPEPHAASRNALTAASTPRVKPSESVEAGPPHAEAENLRKRALFSTDSASEPSTPKRLKREPSTGSPLTSLTNQIKTAGGLQAAGSSVVPQSTASSSRSLSRTNSYNAFPMQDYSDLRSKIDELQMKISTEQRKLDTYLRKPDASRTKGDHTRIVNLTNEIEGMKMQRDEWKSAIPSAAAMAPMSPVKRTPMLGPALPPPPSAPVSVKSEPQNTNLTVVPSVNPNRASNAVATGSFVKNESPRGTSVKPLPPPVSQSFPVVPVLKNELQPVAGPSTSTSAKQMPTQLPAFGNAYMHGIPGAFHGDDMDVDQEPGHALTDEDGTSRLSQQMAERYQEMGAIPNIALMGGSDAFDATGDYYGRGKDHFQGPRAKADDIEKFLVAAGNAELFDGSATVEDALKKLGLPNLFSPIPGMAVALMPHQVIGVAWMVEKEKSDLKGGVLADDMGLGKTVQMIAVMMKNRSENPKCKTNLILAPLSLLDQWKLEIELKTNEALKCLIYHGSSKPKKTSDLMYYDVVLTTYNTMANEWPDYEAEIKKQKAKKKKKDDFIDDDDEEEEKGKGKLKVKPLGLLFQAEFYRIVLDEAQQIRNRRTRMSRAVTELQSQYRWCLTGTPIINSIQDTYPYLRFLQVRPWYDLQEFQREIGRHERKKPQLAVARLQKVLDTCLLRRKKDTQLDGKPLVELPPKEVILQTLQFSEEERGIYQSVETQSQQRFNRYLRAGTVLKNYSTVLALLLRLRQCCSHPALIQEDAGVAFLAADEIDDESRPGAGKELKRARDLVSTEFVDKVKEKLKAAALHKMKAENEQATDNDDEQEETECSICFDVFTDPVITHCGHTFCRECLLSVLNAPVGVAENEAENPPKNDRPCPQCRTSFDGDLIFTLSAFEPTEEELNPKKPDHVSDMEMLDVEDELMPKKKGKGNAKPKRKARRAVDDEVIDVDAIETDDESNDEYEDDDNLSDFIVPDDADDGEYTPRPKKMKKPLMNKRKHVIVIDSDEDEDPEEKELILGRKRKALSAKEIKMLPRFFPSTKMKYMMNEIVRLAKEHPDEKTMVVSQWTSCLKLVSEYLDENGIAHVRYQGDMSRNERDKSVRVFMARDKAKVLLMSLKCGGVGLNLTRANNVISLDLGWSQAIEDQAFDRVHRLGQVRDVRVSRLVIENTVEDRILNMQQRKKDIADGSLGEGNGKKIGKLTVAELAALFNLNTHGDLL
ncbi:hypothetical protein D9758_007422 [Tetrapyrgos nigripes]|uniref:Uncharacterized protein n=1 Tax=Tetrapyrgos nigripes TaxID=182062 RepID=A0A8H5G3V3_9AGAR|nr:hypothetical protein D9758_007422 [Tetrapyrgos nigripes]